jgi:hypothetical protein
MIHHRASRNLKHMSVITCISAAWESLTPYIMTSQGSESLRRTLMISRSSTWRWFCRDPTIETIRECSSFSRVRQQHLYPLPQRVPGVQTNERMLSDSPDG